MTISSGAKVACAIEFPRPGVASVVVELRYQPIGYRWARNLEPYNTAEPRALLRYYDAPAWSSSVVVATASRTIEVARGAF